MKSPVLSSEVRVRPAFLRSVHLERDSSGMPLQGYVPTARAMETLRRLVDALADPASGRAWSITGPYGAGKSYFAAFLDALCGPDDDHRRVAEALVGTVDPVLLGDLRASRAGVGGDAGLVRAVATAQREPVGTTVLRALHNGIRRRWPRGGAPRGLATALRRAGAEGVPSARQLVELVRRTADASPVLLVIDEFGKNLEYLAEDPAGGDLFVLQELAEAAGGQAGMPVLFLTLAHLAFADYAASAGLNATQRREWAKVQGRFEDVVFTESTEQTVQIIASTLDHDGQSRAFGQRLRRWAGKGFAGLKELGVAPGLVGAPELLAGCYPLHPLAAATLPELCARFGQHERTLVAFVASNEPGSVANFLSTTPLPPQRPLPTVGLDAVYDYFVAAAAAMVASSPDAGRWLEIETRLREAQGLDNAQLVCLKTVAVLNLVSAGGVLRASTTALALALEDDLVPSSALVARLAELEQRGLLTHRGFADEYRIWQGSDFDIRAELDAARARVRAVPLPKLLARVAPPAPVVAARHSQRVGMVRFFDTAYRDQHGPFDVSPTADGLVAYIVGPMPDSVATVAATKPVVLVPLVEVAELRAAVVEAAAHLEVLATSEELRSDWVARREMQARVGIAVDVLRSLLGEALRPRSATAGWRLLDGTVLDVSAGASRALSEVCDNVYDASPEVNSEMLGRRELTSQGAKARRELLLAMVERSGEERLGISGFGPERAMYEAVLRHQGVHRSSGSGDWGFGPPAAASSLAAAWAAVDELLLGAVEEAVSVQRVYEVLGAPPFGVKEGPVPVLLAAVLLHRSDEVAIYQEGTYQPQLTADLLERLVKTPDRFALKSFVPAGPRQQLLDAVVTAVGEPLVGRRRRNVSVLQAASPLLAAVRSLPEYTLRTSSGSSDALAVRAALVEAREPDELLFSALPAACGLDPFASHGLSRAVDAEVFVERLTTAIEELCQAYSRLLDDSAGILSEAFSLPLEMSELRQDLRARARRLEGQVIDPRLRSFLFIAADSQLDDEQWLEAVLLNVSHDPPRSWRDDDVSRFAVNLVALAGLFCRVEALYFVTRENAERGFDAQRVTVTAASGEETSSVFWVDHDVRSHMAVVAEEAAGRAREMAGPEGLSALIAVLAGMVNRGSESSVSGAEPLREESVGG